MGLEFRGKGNVADGVYAQVLASIASDAACFYGLLKSLQRWSNCIARGAGAGTAGANYGFRATGDKPSILNVVAYNIDGAGGTSFGVHTVDPLAQVYNAIAVDCDTDFGATSPAVLDYCISSDATATGPHSIPSQTTAAIFVSAGNRDFRLLSTSPAVNTGYPLGLIFSTDFDGDARATPWEIGAYDGFASALLIAPIPAGKCSPLSRCWLIERLDSAVLALTDHNRSLIHDGVSYEPAAGFDQSAVRSEGALRGGSVEIRGAVLASVVTQEDLWAKRYHGARITEIVVNWRFPWAAPLTKRVFKIARIRHTKEEWIAELEDQATQMSQEVGVILTRDCRHQLGDANCTFDVRPLSEYGVAVTSVPTTRAVFRASGMASHADAGSGAQHFAFGVINWLTGANAGLVSECKFYVNADREFEIQEPTFFDIQAGDTFDAIVGCSGIKDDCTDKFDNLDNFGGAPFAPGADRVLEGPSE